MVAVWFVLALMIGPGARALPAPSDGVQADAQAVERYRAGDLEGARDAWLALLAGDDGPRGAERARLFHNLGDVHARRDDWSRAVGWYAASLRLRPRDAETWHDVELARMKAGLEPQDRGDLSATLQRALSSLTLEESAWLALLALVPLALCLAGEALRGGALWRRLSLASSAWLLLCLVPWSWNLARADDDPLLVISEKDVGVHSEPRADAPGVGTLAAGSEIERLDALPGWVKVALPGGRSGWVPGETVFPLGR
ncbi:MAG: SH3 domain-containing protein [Planctomycetota bacterium]|jgi:hypothetical protein|nr:SH3 domain-containing protein [Planctomycetota bacterium]MDP6763520.1 SH3 domain-containing protein [Planctomycetota bacterium]MDP6990793.1 SH3 domain-containing protein [Planctomycetota bacterium]